MKLVSTINRSLGFKAKIYDNSEWSEYIVKFYDENGHHILGADYHTDDIDEARGTAHNELNRLCDSMMI